MFILRITCFSPGCSTCAMFISLLLSFIHVRDVAFTLIYAIVRPSSSIKIRKTNRVCGAILFSLSLSLCASFSFSCLLFAYVKEKSKL